MDTIPEIRVRHAEAAHDEMRSTILRCVEMGMNLRETSRVLDVEYSSLRRLSRRLGLSQRMGRPKAAEPEEVAPEPVKIAPVAHKPAPRKGRVTDALSEQELADYRTIMGAGYGRDEALEMIRRPDLIREPAA